MQFPTEVVLSPTRVAGGLKCLRKQVVGERLGQGSNDWDSPALEFGDLMHRVVALFWMEGYDVAKEFLLQTFVAPLDSKHTPELAHKLLQVYQQQAKLMPFGDSDEWEVETLEERFSVPVPFGTLTFQIDRSLRHKGNGARALVDLKTASRTDARWERQWPRSLQMKLYSECYARYHGQPLSWLVIEGLDKTQGLVKYVCLPDVSEEKRLEAWHAVEWVARHDKQLLDAARMQDGSVDANRLIELALTQTPFNEGECFTYGSSCQFLPLCDAEPSERSALLSADYHWEQPKHLV